MDSISVKRQLQQKRGRPNTAEEDKILDSLSSRDRLRLWQMVDFDPCIDITKVELPALPAGANDTSVLDEELDPFEIARLKADKTPRQRPSNVNQPQPTFWRSSKPSSNQPNAPSTPTTSSPTTRKHSATSPPSSLNRANSNSNSLMTQDSVKNILQKKLGRPRTRAEDAYINKLNARDCARIAQIIQHSEEGLDITKIELVPIRDESEELPRSSSLRVNSQPSTPLLHRTASDREDKSPINKKEPTDELDDLPIYSASSLQTKIDNEKALHSNHMTEMCDSRKARVPKFSGQNSNIKPSISTSRAQESDADARIAKLRQRFQEGTGKQVVAQTARSSTNLRQPFQNLNTPTAPPSSSTSSPSYSMALVNTNSQSQQSFKSTPLTGEARLYQQKLQQKLGQFSIGPKKRIL